MSFLASVENIYLLIPLSIYHLEYLSYKKFPSRLYRFFLTKHYIFPYIILMLHIKPQNLQKDCFRYLYEENIFFRQGKIVIFIDIRKLHIVDAVSHMLYSDAVRLSKSMYQK